MNTNINLKNIAGILMITSILLAFSVIPVLASPPENDNFADATIIGNFPFSDNENTSEATIEPGDPNTCVGQHNSIWYIYNPVTSGSLNITANTDSGYYVTLSIYRSENGNLTQISCMDSGQVTTQLNVTEGESYYFELMARQIGAYPPPGQPPYPDGGNVTLIITENSRPSNDDFANAKVITEIPYYDALGTTYASTQPDEPNACGFYLQTTVWYSFTPQMSGPYLAESTGWWPVLAVYTGTDLNNLQIIDCRTTYELASVPLSLIAGTTYYFQTYVYGGDVTININQRPANDDFANMQAITQPPYSDSVDTTYATAEPWESECGWGFRSIWYSFTPTTSGSYTAETVNGYLPGLGVYTGSDFSSLQNLACVSGWNEARSTLRLDAGTTYYYQAYINDVDWYWDHIVTINLYTSPSPEARIMIWPEDPRKAEEIAFYNISYDPVGVGFQSCTWDFGDGSTASDCDRLHAYTADGDYTVQLTTTTFDGRSASTSQTVQVRTHDVGITRFVVPTTARTGQTKQVTVYIKNLYYAETVQIDLYKSTVNGYELVGTVTQDVPQRPPNRPQAFTFTYTFTSQDADLGKVTFKAVATIINARDAYTPDNEMVSIATKVAR
jgi:hypothetical protein